MKPAAGASILAAALIVSLVWLSQACALADELPADTNQIEGLTPEQAKKLAAEFPGVLVVIEGSIGTSVIERSLPLNGLKSLDTEIAKALAEFKGSLNLSGLTTLDAATAKVLAESKAWDGQLPRITAFESPDSVEIATALAKRKGPLSLRSLTKISPKTLTALIEKEDVEIPLIETLELIQEPDGSPTEDFVIPKGFQARQKARQQGR
jgi:hypothetical protein